MGQREPVPHVPQLEGVARGQENGRATVQVREGRCAGV